MAVTFQLPPAVEERLRRELGDLDRAAMEAALVELYRREKIDRVELGAALGLSRFGVDALLKQYGVTEDLMTLDEFRAELDFIDRSGQR